MIWGTGEFMQGERTARALVLDILEAESRDDDQAAFDLLDAHLVSVVDALVEEHARLARELERTSTFRAAEAEGWNLLTPELERAVLDEEWFRGPANEIVGSLSRREFVYPDGYVKAYERHAMVTVLWREVPAEPERPLVEPALGALDKLHKVAETARTDLEPEAFAVSDEAGPGASGPESTPTLGPADHPGAAEQEVEQEVELVAARQWLHAARELAATRNGGGWSSLAASELIELPAGVWCGSCLQDVTIGVHAVIGAAAVYAHPRCVARELERLEAAPPPEDVPFDSADPLDREEAIREARRAAPKTYPAKHNPGRLNKDGQAMGDPACYLCLGLIQRGDKIQRSPGGSKRHHARCVETVLERHGSGE